MRLVLDAKAVNSLLDPRHPAERQVRRAMEAARRLRREVAIATGTLADGTREPDASGATQLGGTACLAGTTHPEARPETVTIC
jgi:hypothetical protein